MSDQAYQGIHYDEPHVQAQFERLLQGIRAAEQARAPLADRQRQTEDADETGTISSKQVKSAEDAYIAAGNAIAAAQRAVDAFLQANKNYKVG